MCPTQAAMLVSNSQALQATRPPLLPRPPAVPKMPTIAFTYASDEKREPDEPIQTNFQQRMLHAFEHQGHWGLAMELYLQAERKMNSGSKPASWRKIAEDRTNEHFTVYIQLLTLPDFIIPSLIRNTITLDRVSNSRIHQYILSQMEPTVLPGVYVNILTRGAPAFAAQRQVASNGVWLSPREAMDMKLCYESYLKTGGVYDALAQKIDRYMTPMPKRDRETARKDHSFRRYAPSPTAKETARQWIAIIGELYVDNVDTAKMDLPSKRCLYEVGWGVNVKQRLDDHSANRNTTYVYGFLNMWTRCMLQTPFPSPQQMTLFRVWANDPQIAQVSEIAASMLCSSYVTEGGLNVKEAGTSVIAKGKPAHHKHWTLNAEHIFQHSAHFHSALQKDWEREKKINLTLRSSRNLPTRMQRVQELEEEAKTLKQSLQSTERRLEEVKTRHRKAEGEWDSKQASVLASESQNTDSVQRLRMALSSAKMQVQRDQDIKTKAYCLFVATDSLDEALAAGETASVDEDVIQEVKNLNARLDALRSRVIEGCDDDD